MRLTINELQPKNTYMIKIQQKWYIVRIEKLMQFMCPALGKILISDSKYGSLGLSGLFWQKINPNLICLCIFFLENLKPF